MTSFLFLLMDELLLVEDKAELREMLRTALTKAGYQVDEAADGTTAVSKLRSRRYLVILTDLKLPGCSGIEVLRAAREADPDVPVILMTAYGSIEEAVTAMKGGAYDFIQKPIDLDHLNLLLRRAVHEQQLQRENILLRDEYARHYGLPKIVGEHATLVAVSAQIQKIAPTDMTVLLEGESGTGKELFARAVHYLSQRAQHPFVALNCAAIPEGLVENELFGHEKGAYTGAGARKIGKFELANHGTLFLDEIGDLPLPVQSKLLRVLEERSFERVGGTQTIQIDVRIITATNRKLRQAVEAKTFREDLYFRIAALPITVPPLRERASDILLLAEHFLQQYAREFRKRELKLSEEARHFLRSYNWPGNVRELQNAMERAVLLSDGNVIRPEHFNLPLDSQARAALPKGLPIEEFDWNGTLDDVASRAARAVERVKIEEALRAAHWNKAKAAEMLGVSYKTLLNKIRQLGLES